MHRETQKIYVVLRDEGTRAWRSVDAIEVKEGAFKIISTNSDPDDESWEFKNNEIVRCENKKFSDGSVGLVAVERLSGNT